MELWQGDLTAPASTTRIALIAARFNELVVKELIAGAQDALLRHGMKPAQLVLIRVPGAYEIVHAAKLVAARGDFAGMVALGCVIRGETAHFDYVAGASNSGLLNITLEHKIPIGFGILTVDSLDQALARAGSKAGNKGAEAALAVLEQINLSVVIAGGGTADSRLHLHADVVKF
jgi:6,7-dimethyl-8-ribityllumazine synthase